MWTFSTLTRITIRVDINAIRRQPNTQNCVHTTSYQNTHQASYRVGWPGRFGALNPNPSLPFIYFCLSGFQSSLLLIYFLMVHTKIICNAAVYFSRQKRLCMTLRLGVQKNRSDVWRSTFTMGAAWRDAASLRYRNCAESRFSYVNRSPIRYGFRGGTRALR